jgi:hypothetical protein
MGVGTAESLMAVALRTIELSIDTERSSQHGSLNSAACAGYRTEAGSDVA